jgi:hypothetical protein
MDSTVRGNRAETEAAPRSANAAPFRAQPTTVEETGISFGQLTDLCVKTIYQVGRVNARDISDRLSLPFAGVIEPVLSFLKREKFVEVVGAGGLSEQQYQYSLSDRGNERATEALDRNQYVGPAPVPFTDYVEVSKEQSIRRLSVDSGGVSDALGDLVMTETTRSLVGPAVNSGRTILLYGEPGNGKSSIAKGIRRMLKGQVLIPYAVDVNGQTIRVFDQRVHQPVDNAAFERRRNDMVGMANDPRLDTRWVVCQRPLIIAGGELTLGDLELKYSPQSRFYIAPIQMKANCGVLVIDDLGRQLVRPQELLNRWILPMEGRVDYLSLLNGETIEVPFELLLVFSTNIPPSELGDEAFFRRIRHKIEVGDPDEISFLEILRRACELHSIPYADAAGRYLIERFYRPTHRPLRGVHPRDIVDLLLDISSFQKRSPEFTPEWIDLACASYFIDENAIKSYGPTAARAA